MFARRRTTLLAAMVSALAMLLVSFALSSGARADDGDEGEPDLPPPSAEQLEPVPDAFNTTITRSQVRTRAETWLSPRPVPYSQKKTRGGYRTDCSGFVSMAWNLSNKYGGLTTTWLHQVSHRINKADLQLGDVLLAPGKHVVMFDRWTDSSRTAYYAYEQVGKPYSKTMHRIVSVPYDTSPSSYTPWRYNKIVNDPTPPAPPAPPARKPYELVSPDDLNGDGRTDLAAVQQGVTGGTLWLYPGRGAATFGNRASLGTNWDTMREVTGLGDFNGDGTSDMVAVDKASGRLLLYPATGGTYGTRKVIGSSGWNQMSSLVGLRHASPDNPYPVLLAVDTAAGVLYHYPITANGFGTRIRLGSGWTGMRELTSLDLNNDGLDDLLTVEKATGKLWMYPAKGDGTYHPRIMVGSGGWNGMRSLEGVADVTDDGVADLMAIDAATGQLFLYPGQSDPGFGNRILLGSGWNG